MHALYSGLESVWFAGQDRCCSRHRLSQQCWWVLGRRLQDTCVAEWVGRRLGRCAGQALKPPHAVC
jgi:hypothetical protein